MRLLLLVVLLGGSSLSIQGAEEDYPRCSLAPDDDVARLARSGLRPRALYVSASDAGLRRLARSRLLRKVEILAVCGDDAGIRAIVRSRHLRAVEELTVIAYPDEPLDAATITALVTSPRLATLRLLHLTSGDSAAERTISGDSADALIEHLDLPALRELDLSWTPLSAAQVIALVRAPWAAQLERLDLCETAAGPAVVDALIAEQPRLSRLTDLCLSAGGDDRARLTAAYGASFRHHWD